MEVNIYSYLLLTLCILVMTMIIMCSCCSVHCNNCFKWSHRWLFPVDRIMRCLLVLAARIWAWIRVPSTKILASKSILKRRLDAGNHYSSEFLKGIRNDWLSGQFLFHELNLNADDPTMDWLGASEKHQVMHLEKLEDCTALCKEFWERKLVPRPGEEIELLTMYPNALAALGVEEAAPTPAPADAASTTKAADTKEDGLRMYRTHAAEDDCKTDEPESNYKKDGGQSNYATQTPPESPYKSEDPHASYRDQGAQANYNLQPSQPNYHVQDSQSNYQTQGGQSNYQTQGQSNYQTQGQSNYQTQTQSYYKMQGQSNYQMQGQSNYQMQGESKYKVQGQSNYKMQGQSNYQVHGPQSDYKMQGAQADYTMQAAQEAPAATSNTLTVGKKSKGHRKKSGGVTYTSLEMDEYDNAREEPTERQGEGPTPTQDDDQTPPPPSQGSKPSNSDYV